MPENRVSASLSQTNQKAVLDAIQTIREKLPFLIDLTPDERRSLPKLGDKSQAFVTQALTVATQNSDILPRSFDVAEFRQDVDLWAALQPLTAALTQLQELVEDTYLEVGSEAYMAALAVYSYAKASGKGAALDGLLEGMAQRFARKTSKPAKPDAGK
jgi:catalase (peroxidase I)